jgi:hypothetical protein
VKSVKKEKLLVAFIFFRKIRGVSYAIARHLGADKKFYYHQQSLECVNRKLGELSIINHGQELKNQSIDQSRINSSTLLDLEPSAGFGPATITLPR